MQFNREPIKIEDIDTLMRYKMIDCLLKYNDIYEARCLVNVFIKNKNDDKELETMKIILNLLNEYKIEEVKILLKSKIVIKKEKFNIFKVLQTYKKKP